VTVLTIDHTGYFTPVRDITVQLFLVDGGGAGGSICDGHSCGGGGGGGGGVWAQCS